MSPKQRKELVVQYIEQVWNRADAATFNRLTAPGFTFRLGNQPPRDDQSMRQFVQAVHTAFPDWRVWIKALVAESDIVAARWAGVVTHDGPFHGIPATGRRVKVCGINLYMIENDKIACEWEQMDALGMLAQMGIGPAAVYPSRI